MLASARARLDLPEALKPRIQIFIDHLTTGKDLAKVQSNSDESVQTTYGRLHTCRAHQGLGRSAAPASVAVPGRGSVGPSVGETVGGSSELSLASVDASVEASVERSGGASVGVSIGISTDASVGVSTGESASSSDVGWTGRGSAAASSGRSIGGPSPGEG